MIIDIKNAQKIAFELLQIKAIKLQPQSPFTWASGWKSPIYCDNRISLSYVEMRQLITRSFADQIRSLYPDVEIIAGVATGAIGIGMLVAQALELPFIYVRPEPKKHGRKNQIEGLVPKDKKVVVIEDLISTGKSSLNAVKALKESGANVLGMLAIFTYGFETATQNFKDMNVDLHTLSNYENLLKIACTNNYISDQQLDILSKWREAPEQWTGL